MRLRNRIVKATFWTAGDLARWHRDKREFYRSLWACAEDSCCLIDDMFEVKLTAWPSPMDADLTVELFEQWRDEMVADGKLIRYHVNGQPYLYIPAMVRHERPRNPQEPDWPLPAWVTFSVSGEGRARRVTFVHSAYSDCTDNVQTCSGSRSTSPVLSCPEQPSPETRPLSLARLQLIDPAVLGRYSEKVGRGYDDISDKELDGLRGLCNRFPAEVVSRIVGQYFVQLAEGSIETPRDPFAYMAGMCRKDVAA